MLINERESRQFEKIATDQTPEFKIPSWLLTRKLFLIKCSLQLPPNEQPPALNHLMILPAKRRHETWLLMKDKNFATIGQFDSHAQNVFSAGAFASCFYTHDLQFIAILINKCIQNTLVHHRSFASLSCNTACFMQVKK